MSPELLSQQINTAWVLISAALVFFMQAGFAMVTGGSLGVKNNVNIMLKSLLDFCIASLVFWAVGYALMFGAGNGFIGLNGFFLSGLSAEVAGIPLLAFWLFQVVFCGTAATIVCGAVAERMKFIAYLIYSAIISALIYPIIGHWIWGGGWLAARGFLDFAGSTVVHAVGGFSALAAVIVLGARKDRYTHPEKYRASSIPLVALGVFILWLGWFGFNGGSTLGLTDTELVSRVIVNTTLAAAAGGLMSLFAAWIIDRRPDAMASMNGTLAGLVGITAGCAYVTPISAIIIGAISGIILVGGLHLLEYLKIDDAIGAAPVHAFGGIFGTIAVGLFHTQLGLFTSGQWNLLGIQTLGTIVASAFAFATMYGLFMLMKYTIGIRISEYEEEMGIDLVLHNVHSYPEFVPHDGAAMAAGITGDRMHARIDEMKEEKMKVAS